MKQFKKVIAGSAAVFMMTLASAAPVHAEGYWVDGYWDDASQTWIEGKWVENGASGGQSWTGGGNTTQYCNGAVITYDANWNRISTVVTNVPVYSQHNPAWAGITIGTGGNFGSTGCVPTAAAIIMNHFGVGGSPLDFGYMMNAWGNYNAGYGHGCDSAALLNAGYASGLGAAAFSDYNSLYNELARGRLVAACIGGASAYTHCVVLYGLDAYGNTNVSDPSGYSYRTNIAGIVNNMSYNPIDWTAGGPFVSFGWE